MINRPAASSFELSRYRPRNSSRRFKPPHVARAVIANVQKLLPNVNLSGRHALVIGYGSIGEQVALHLKDALKMRVSVFDVNSNKVLKAQQHGFDIADSLTGAVKGSS